jgi:hypothetical protein
MQQKIERIQIRQFKSFDFPIADAGEMFFDALGRDLADKNRVILWFESDQPDIRCVTFVPRTRVCDFEKWDFHVQLFDSISLALSVAVIGHRKCSFGRINRNANHVRFIVLLFKIGDKVCRRVLLR